VASWVALIRHRFRVDPWGTVARCAAALSALALLLFLWQAFTAVRALSTAQDSADRLVDAIVSGDVHRAKIDLAAFDDATTRAHHRTDGPMWWIGAKVPVLGRNIDAVSTIAEQSDVIADQALPRIVQVADKVRLDTFRPENGRVNLAAVAQALPVLAATDRVFSRADRAVGQLQPDRMVAPLEQPVAAFQQKVHSAAAGIAAAHDAGRLLPNMLGGDGKTRRYLLLVMNNAEVRSIGGMPGSYAVLEARRGKLSMKQQAGNTEMKRLKKPLLNIRREVRAGFDKDVGVDIRDAASIPDFPRVAALASGIAGDHWATDFDGVVAIDPLALGYVLGAVGQVDIGDRMAINQANAAPTLLNGIYLRYPDDPAAQDDAFERAARRSFDALTSGRGDSVQAIRALVQGVQERRVLLWSRHPTEQARIQSTGIAGSFTDRRQLSRPQVGVFLTDTTQAKMDFYLRAATQVTPTKCYEGGVQDIRLTTTLGSEAPEGGPPLPVSVTGFGKTVGRGNIGLSVRIIAPPGGEIRSVLVDGHRAPVGATFYRGRQVKRIIRILSPGVSTVIVTEIRTGRATPGAPLLHSTPGVLANDDVVGMSACA
jgi:hypothetical protein